MMDGQGDDGKKHFNLKSIMKKEKMEKRRKRKKSAMLEAQEKYEREINVNDARVSALYASQYDAVYLSDPTFK